MLPLMPPLNHLLCHWLYSIVWYFGKGCKVHSVNVHKHGDAVALFGVTPRHWNIMIVWGKFAAFFTGDWLVSDLLKYWHWKWMAMWMVIRYDLLLHARQVADFIIAMLSNHIVFFCLLMAMFSCILSWSIFSEPVSYCDAVASRVRCPYVVVRPSVNTLA